MALHLILFPFFSSFSATEFVIPYTIFSPIGASSIINLAYTPYSLKASASFHPPIGTSDHNSILITICLPLSIPLTAKPQATRRFNYSCADFASTNQSLPDIDWKSILIPDPKVALSISIQCSFQRFTNSHHTQLFQSFSSPPWPSQSLCHKIHMRRALFHHATLSHNPHDWLRYRTSAAETLL